MTPDQAAERIERLFERKGLASPGATSKLEGRHNDATVSIGPELPAVKVRPSTDVTAPPQKPVGLGWRDVIVPADAPTLGPLAEARFKRAWRDYLEASGQPLTQPTTQDVIAWREKDVNTPQEPNKLAHLIEVGDAVPTDWSQVNRVTDAVPSAPRLGNTFGTDGRGNAR
jgi:hypothetical protein